MDMTLISVVMPAYNSEKYLRQAVESVLAQTVTDWELLLLDDGSTDAGPALMEQLAARDGRIRVHYNEQNLGVGQTRTRGVALAEGEWIAFLDSDDMWTADKLEKQLALLERFPQAALLYTGSGFMTESGALIDYVLHVPEKIDRRRLLKQNLVSCSSVLVRREWMLRCPFPRRRDLHEDFFVWLQILQEEDCAYGVDEPLLIYRRSAASKSANKLKAARMNWNTYRAAGLGLPASLYNMGWYAVNSLRKYRHL